MGYTVRRLQEALRVFRLAKAKDKREAEELAKRTSAHKYSLRHQHIEAPQNALSRVAAGDSSDDEDYDPDAARKKKTEVKAGKRKAEEKVDGERRVKKSKTILDAERLENKDAFLTLSLTSEKGRKLLQNLGAKYGTTPDTGRKAGHYLSCKPSSTVPGNTLQDQMSWERKTREEVRMSLSDMTYTERLDEESREIDNRGGRALRNRKVPEMDTAPRKSKAKAPSVEAEATSETAHHEHIGPTDLLTPPSSGDDRHRFHGTDSFVFDRSARPAPRDLTLPSPVHSSDADLGESFFIKTNFAHPIDFKSKVSPCDFCLDFRFGITGMEEVIVEVFRLPNSAQYEEMGDGHRANGCQQTKMCVKCALSRLKISRCHSHELKPIQGIAENCLSAQFEAQRAVPPGTLQKSVHPVCSLCQNPSSLRPATARCCKRQRMGLTGKPLPDGQTTDGCGLYLCRFCQRAVREDQGVIREARFGEISEEWSKPERRRPRADLEFLFPNSLLHRAYRKPPAG